MRGRSKPRKSLAQVVAGLTSSHSGLPREEEETSQLGKEVGGPATEGETEVPHRTHTLTDPTGVSEC